MQRTKRPCAAPGCSALVEKGYCPAHVPRAMAVQRRYEDQRGNSHRRGYDSRWRQFREWFLRQRENVICADCRVQPSTDVHHVKKLRLHPELRFEPANCRGLCHRCHSKRTLAGE